ncbi:hypothetical protein EDEG_03616 [Edhazardia aedis USNM 41457]|uniref:EF-hand domain-containing protein n=1 Tax=Edhazardia aedis (strain USNM 41457) TaxID=1003232 RepID=J9D2W0_EDHAE|nr:hypothetical protein EDEG_03616 [Edhazardia aedis USNM 41457]|eukprot:EJW01914.1 hypothetical protein EDEG_03616 [Edhazardia aedis USNM 41457]
MEYQRQNYEFFIKQHTLTKQNIKHLIRLCGKSPTEEQIANLREIPENFEDFQELLNTFEIKLTKQDMYDQLSALTGGTSITKHELVNILNSKKKLSEKDMESFLNMLQFDDEYVSIKEIVNLLFDEIDGQL